MCVPDALGAGARVCRVGTDTLGANARVCRVDTDTLGTNARVASAQIRVTKEELYTTALIAHAYGGSGLSAFNFIYTRPYFDLPWLGLGSGSGSGLGLGLALGLGLGSRWLRALCLQLHLHPPLL